VDGQEKMKWKTSWSNIGFSCSKWVVCQV